MTATLDPTPTRSTPWGRIGVSTEGATTAREAIVRAGLDWTVDPHPVQLAPRTKTAPDGTVIEEPARTIPDRFAMIRSDNSVIMNLASSRYVPYQNVNAFSFMDHFVAQDLGTFETGGSSRGGRSVFLSMQLGEDVRIGGEDVTGMYLLLRTSHDGSGRISVNVTPVRYECTNMNALLIGNVLQSWGITHTGDVEGKMKEAQRTLELYGLYKSAYEWVGNELVKVTVSDNDLVKLLEETLDDRPRRDDEVEGILTQFRSSPNIQNFRNTGWGALNAVSEYEEHIRRADRTNTSGEAAFERLLTGKDMKLRTAVKDRLLAAA
jgi:phage/plasmid-like protein (TIGR03299 family)